MRSRPLLLTLLLATVLVGGCAYPGHDARLVPGVSTAAEVTSYYGAPHRIWEDAGGGRTYEYSSQPLGTHCYMVRLDAAGRLIGVEDTLSYDSRFSITPGMSPEQVSRRLGQERTRVTYRFSGEEVWDWNIEPDPGSSYRMRFNVHFKDGVVLRLSQSMVFPTRFGWDD